MNLNCVPGFGVDGGLKPPPNQFKGLATHRDTPPSEQLEEGGREVSKAARPAKGVRSKRSNMSYCTAIFVRKFI